MTDAAVRLLADVGPELRVVLERLPSHFILTAAAIAESNARGDVLDALCGLLAANVDHIRREADAVTAQLAVARRSHLALVPDPHKGA